MLRLIMLIAKKGMKELHLLPEMSNRHGLIAGATGSGKTVSIQVMIENFSKIGVPSFVTDIKGDLQQLHNPGQRTKKIAERLKILSIQRFRYKGYPTKYWDVFGEDGNPINIPLYKLKPAILIKLLNLTPVQQGTLYQIYKIINHYKTFPYTLQDLHDIIGTIIEEKDHLEPTYGRLSPSSLSAIQRSITFLESTEEDILFKYSDFNPIDLIQTDENSHGIINIFSARKLIDTPQIYATFLIWLLDDLFSTLPERGDCDKPIMVLFFDEAHLLFTDTPKVLTDTIIRTIRLIRSKGVGIYFITQNPTDIPDAVLSQLGNRIQHTLRALTPKEQQAIRMIAKTFRNNGHLDIEEAITSLKIGEALVSFLDRDGSPEKVTRAWIMPPRSHIGA